MTVFPELVGAHTTALLSWSTKLRTRHCHSSSLKLRLNWLSGGRRSCIFVSWNSTKPVFLRSSRAAFTSLRKSRTKIASRDKGAALPPLPPPPLPPPPSFFASFFAFAAASSSFSSQSFFFSLSSLYRAFWSLDRSPASFFSLSFLYSFFSSFPNPTSAAASPAAAPPPPAPSLPTEISASAARKVALASIAQRTSNAAGVSSPLSDPSRIMSSFRNAPALVTVFTDSTSATAPFLALFAALSSFSQSEATSLARCFSMFTAIMSSFVNLPVCPPPPPPFLPPLFFLPPFSSLAAAAAAAASAVAVACCSSFSSTWRAFSFAQASRGSNVESGARLRRITGIRLLAFFFFSRRLMMTQIMSVGECVQYRSYMRSKEMVDCASTATTAAAT
mmetsp:Transcript_11672/g.23572  ORF Transcript_11672/g.23572 Transcript_11672/m.23572 type:complete len:390 (-) Transcript_11672:179-1348(-)